MSLFSTIKEGFLEFGEFVMELGKIILISLAIILPIRYYVVQPFYVNGQSMEPTFENNEYLLVDELTYRFQEPARGDVVVFRYPRDPSKFFIKRLVGLPGDTVSIANGQVTITNAAHPQGIMLEEPYIEHQATSGEYTAAVRDGEYFLLGDNRGQSLDSRVFGPVTRDHIVGRVWLRALPVSRWTIFSSNRSTSSLPLSLHLI